MFNRDAFLLEEKTQTHSLTRRAFLKFCAASASLLALSTEEQQAFAANLAKSTKPSVIWLSFQECTGCTESFTRSNSPTIESLIFDYISLDYQHTLQAASGEAAENARRQAMKEHKGKYLLVVDGSIPSGKREAYSTIAGMSNLAMLRECVKDAEAIIAIGSCSAFGGLPAARPNPTGALGITECMEQGLIAKKPLVNISGCPPLPIAISSILAHYVAFERFPELDEKFRPLSFYGNTVHERCSRYHFFQQGKFAQSFDDEGARKGWRLYELGCKGPTTHNACSAHKWNEGTSNPIEAGHPCIGCSEPDFWDQGGFYISLAQSNSTSASVHDKGDVLSAGQSLYEDNCVYCHEGDPGVFTTPAENIKQLFLDKKIRAHRSFDFDVEEFDALESFIKFSQENSGAGK